MKVLDLACQHGHVFEGWFGGEADFQHQLSCGLLTCPVCGNGHIAKRLSAPRLNLLAASAARNPPARPIGSGMAPPAGHADAPDPSAAETSVQTKSMADGVSPGQAAAWNSLVSMALRVMASRAEDMGDRFAREARRMHRGEAEAKPIRGQTTAREAQDLREEGIPVLQLPPLNDGPSGPLH